MKVKYPIRQYLILLNQMFVLVFFIYVLMTGQNIDISKGLHLFLITLMIIDGVYITYKNIRCNEILNIFSKLLLLSAWQFMMLLLENETVILTISTFLMIIVFYNAVHFTFLFIFQSSGYVYQKQIKLILKIICISTIIGKIVDDRIFSILFLFQNVISVFCGIFVFVVHRKRVKFILQSEKNQLIISFFTVVIPFILYCILVNNNSSYLENLGSYLLILLPCVSVHNILFNNKKKKADYFLLNKKNCILFICIAVSSMFIIGFILKFNVIMYSILIHSIILLFIVYFILVYGQSVKAQKETDNNAFTKDSFYLYSLEQIMKEEEIKKEFSNYLHDEVLQDLLSIKNMMGKTNKVEVKELIVSTLDKLNVSIRQRMQEYHPVMIKTLTLKENIYNLLNMVKSTFTTSNMDVFLDCDNKTFLVEPYNLIVYRIIKELVTNAFKHSKGTKIKIILVQENGEIKLVVIDDGIGIKDTINLGTSKAHKGLSSIYEQILSLNGKMDISKNKPFGTQINIYIPMKGDGSYEYFVS